MNSLLLSKILLPVDRYNQSWIKRTTKIDFVMTFRAFNIKKLKINCFVFCLFVFSIMCLFLICCDVSCGLLVSNRIFDVTCQSLIKDEKKNTPQLFSTKCRQWNLGLIYHIVRKKSVHQNAWNWSFTVDTKMFQTDFFLTSEEFRLTIETLSEFEDWMSMTLMFYFFKSKIPTIPLL